MIKMKKSYYRILLAIIMLCSIFSASLLNYSDIDYYDASSVTEYQGEGNYNKKHHSFISFDYCEEDLELDMEDLDEEIRNLLTSRSPHFKTPGIYCLFGMNKHILSPMVFKNIIELSKSITHRHLSIMSYIHYQDGENTCISLTFLPM